MGEKTLLVVTKDDVGTGVKITCDNAEEMFILSVALVQSMEGYPAFKAIFNYVKDELKNDDEFRKLVEKSSVSSQDFNEILKNL